MPTPDSFVCFCMFMNCTAAQSIVPKCTLHIICGGVSGARLATPRHTPQAALPNSGCTLRLLAPDTLAPCCHASIAHRLPRDVPLWPPWCERLLLVRERVRGHGARFQNPFRNSVWWAPPHSVAAMEGERVAGHGDVEDNATITVAQRLVAASREGGQG
jgi:hypothetical protein